MQNLFNLADQHAADVFAECAARDIAFVPFCPLGLPGGVPTRGPQCLGPFARDRHSDHSDTISIAIGVHRNWLNC